VTLRRLLLLASVFLLAALAAACAGDAETGNGNPSPGDTSDLPTAAPLPGGTVPSVEGPLILYRSTIEADAIASTLDRTRSWSLDFDPNVEYVVGVDCTPDGQQAAYLMEDNRSLDNRLVIAGTDRREIPLSGEVINAAFSPDGTQLAVTAYLPDVGSGSISLVDAETGESTEVLRRTGTIGAPRWAPDGKSIVFDASADPTNQMFIFTLGDNAARQVGNVASGAFSPDWAPSGDSLIFSSYTADGNPQLFTMPATGGEAVQLTSTQVFKAFPRWAPDGSAIAYVGTILVPTTARIDAAPQVSSAGRVGQGFAPAARRHNVGVYTSAADGTNEQLITDLVQDAWLLGWCTAGPWLASGWTAH
jgi:hypothetical protein